MGWFSQLFNNFEVRLNHTRISDEPRGPVVKEIQCRGKFPISKPINLGVIISVFDVSGSEPVPVISYLEDFQESYTKMFQVSSTIGVVWPNYGFDNWVTVGAVIPEFLQPPYSGDRIIKVLVRLVDLSNPPIIINGNCELSDSGVIWERSINFSKRFSEKGYVQAQKHYEAATTIAIRLGVAVALADGELHDNEGEILRNWIKKKIEFAGDDRRDELKKKYNNDFKKAYNDSLEGNLVIGDLVDRLNQIGDKRSKYEVIDLAYHVMASDGKADSRELEVIKNFATSLGLDYDEINNIKDKKLMNLSTLDSNYASIEDILNIDSSWSNDKILSHLRSEFNKWNNRINILPEGEKRENAQQMLDLISEARKKYA